MSENAQSTMYDEVLDVLDKLRPFLQRDGGDVELVDVEDGIVNSSRMALAAAAQARQSRLKQVSNVHCLKKLKAYKRLCKYSKPSRSRML